MPRKRSNTRRAQHLTGHNGSPQRAPKPKPRTKTRRAYSGPTMTSDGTCVCHGRPHTNRQFGLLRSLAVSRGYTFPLPECLCHASQLIASLQASVRKRDAQA